ncbi:hypothetical protein [Costertonia aggregata]|uniref:Uncharacterized protein n=1 Tax=Costertonia aggregata TaxID=343403 RepID=A0A7H9AS91_9FLAO|nr:hypothetical protein [Costertonia aggregata]QLG46065.1 hypothetical protein HYG79_12150 [Costertonia aggregata]
MDSKKYKSYKPTREEDYIKFYFDNSHIRYQEQFVLKNLRYDSKKHRRVDFYLQNVDVYVEYYGLYNSTKEKRFEYDEKTKVYFRNGLPTIIIYPHELGILDYAFHTKMIQLFNVEKFRNRRNKYYKYLFFRYFHKGEWITLFATVFWAYLSFVFGWELVQIDEGLNAIFFLISFVLTIYNLVTFSTDLIYFIKHKGVLE